MKSLVALSAACLAFAAPAAAQDPPVSTPLYPETVEGAGLTGVAGAQATIQRVVRGSGATATALFSVRPNSVVFVDRSRNLRFRSLRVQTLRFGANDARLQGIGLLNGRPIRFTAVAVHNSTPGVDVLRLTLGARAGLGGQVLRGSLFVR